MALTSASQWLSRTRTSTSLSASTSSPEKRVTSLQRLALHNAWQFYKNDNYFYERKAVARKVEGLIEAMLRSSKPKNWFRAYLNLGLIEKILGHDRLIPCSAGKDFAFIDPWSDVWACNVRSDLPMGNLARQSWDEISIARSLNGRVTRSQAATRTAGWSRPRALRCAPTSYHSYPRTSRCCGS